MRYLRSLLPEFAKVWLTSILAKSIAAFVINVLICAIFYVIFTQHLAALQTIQAENSLTTRIERNAHALIQTTQYTSALLQQVTQDTHVKFHPDMRQLGQSPVLDSLTHLVYAWKHPQATMLLGELTINIRQYSKLAENAAHYAAATDTSRQGQLMHQMLAKVVSDELLPLADEIQFRTKNLLFLLDMELARQQEANQKQIAAFQYWILFLLGSGSVVLLLVLLIIAVSANRQSYSLRRYIDDLANGNIPENIPVEKRISSPIFEKLWEMTNHLRSVKHYADCVSKGSFDTHIQAFNDQGELGTSLAQMRKSLKEVSERDRIRNWQNEGLAKFGELLHQNSDKLEVLADTLILHLMKYVGATHGCVFIVNGDSLALTASYAFNRKKHSEQMIVLGEGLVGQCWREGETMYLDKVPDNYIPISSGLGGAQPKSLAIIPLKINASVIGVLEVASFESITDYQIEFIEKVAAMAAAAITGVTVNEQTRVLLEDSQKMTERLLAQEEEMRQNLEELEATQEEMIRSRREIQRQQANLSAVINNTHDAIVAVDRDFRVIVINNTLQQLYAAKGIQLNIGDEMVPVFSWSEQEEWKAPFLQALAGLASMQVKNYGNQLYEVHYYPIHNHEKSIIGVALFAKDVTERQKAEEQVQTLLEEATRRTEQLQIQESIMLENLHEMQINQQKLQHEEATLSAFINSTDDTIISVNTAFQVTLMNNAFKKAQTERGCPVNLGDSVFIAYAEEQRDHYIRLFNRALSGEKFVVTEKISINHVTHHYDCFFNPIQHVNNEIMGVSLLSREVTERMEAEQEKQALFRATQETTEELKAQEEELRQNLEELMATQEELFKIQRDLQIKEARLSALINNTTNAIFSINTSYVLTALNETAREKYTSEGILLNEGENFLRHLPESEQIEWKRMLNRSLSGETFTEIREEEHAGSMHFLEISCTPVRTDDHEIVGVSIYMKDISKQKTEELERLRLLRESKERQEQLMAQEEMMQQNLEELMIVQHELRAREAQLSSQMQAINNSNCILELNLEGTILDANDNYLHLVHYQHEELFGKPYRMLLPNDDDQTQDFELFWEKLRKAEFHAGEYKLVTKNGNIVWMRATHNPVLDAEGKPYKMLVFAYDITDRMLDSIEKKSLYEKIRQDAEELRQQEEELRQNLEELKNTQEALMHQNQQTHEKEARLRALIDNTDDDIFAIDTEYHITIINRAAQKRYVQQGIALDIGYNIFSIIPSANTAHWKVNFDKALQGEKFSIIDHLDDKEGETFFEVSFNPIRNEKDQVIGVSVLSRNVNKYKMAEKENLQTIDILRKIQDKAATINGTKDNEIEDYRKKVEQLRKEINGKVRIS